MLIQTPPPAPAFVDLFRADIAGSRPRVELQPDAQQPVPLPQIDLVVEVVGNLPLQDKVTDLTGLLGRRSATRSFNRAYPPTILEMITLITRNPERPRGKAWDSIMALTLRYDEPTRMVSVEYCVERCGFDPRTGAFERKRRMVTYTAPEDAVVAKLDKKRRDLAKYADR